MATNSKEKQKEYDKNRSGRTRNWTTLFYPDDLPSNWREKVDGTHVKWIESPAHDRDFNADGSAKKLHHHALFMFESVKNQKQVIEFFKMLFCESDNGTICGVATPQTVSDRCSLVRYFAHMDNPSKAQYDASEIIGHNGADVAEILRYSQSETIKMMIEIEKFIEKKNVTELCDLSALIREERPEWYLLVTTKNTVYFNAFIRSRRHKLRESEFEHIDKIDHETGEVTTHHKEK